MAGEHVSTQDTLSREHVSTQITLSREHVRESANYKEQQGN